DNNENEGGSGYQAFDENNAGYVDKAQAITNIITTLKVYIQLKPTLRADARISRFEDDLEELNSDVITEYTSNEYEIMLKQQLGSRQNITLGTTHKTLETKTNKAVSSFDQALDTTGYYIQHQYQSDRLSTQVGYRIEDHEKYG